MAVAIDNTLVGTGTTMGAVSLALSNFSTGGADRLVLVLIGNSNGASGTTISSVTASGITFVQAKRREIWGSFGFMNIWYGFASAQQTNTVITITPSASDCQIAARTMSFSGADSAIGTNIGEASNFTGTTASTSLVTTAANSLVMAMVGAAANPTITAGTGQTHDGTTTTASATIAAATRQNSVTASSGTTVTSDATLSSGAGGWGIISLEIKEATAPPPAVNKGSTQLMMGV